MNYANYDDVVNQLRAGGLMLDTVKRSQGGVSFGELYVGSTRSVRCDVDGEKKRQTGAYWLHELRLNDGVWITGSFCVDHGNSWFKLELNKECSDCGATIQLKGSFCACGSKKIRSREIPPEQLEAHKIRMAEAKRRAAAERDQEIERASGWASAVWRSCRQAMPGDHDYLAHKQIEQLGGIRIFESNEGIKLDGDKEEAADAYKYLATFHGALVIPACDQNGKVFGLQFILSREKHKESITRMGRDKVYWPSGMSVEGHYWLIGSSPSSLAIVAEGWATGQTLNEATGITVAVAFSANNIGPVAGNLRQHYKRSNLLICADDDWVQRCDAKSGGCGKYTPVNQPECIRCGHAHGKKNTGIEAAHQTAIGVKNTAWLKPEFAVARPNDKKGDTDFNDLRVLEGVQAVRAQVEAMLTHLEWRLPAPVAWGMSGAIAQGGQGKRAALKSMLTIDEALERFALVFGGKGTMFDLQEHNLVPKQDVLDILPEHGWRDMRAHKRVVRLDEVGFDPAGNDTRITCNLWGGWPSTPKQGRCECLLEMLQYLCSNEEHQDDVYRWVIKWLAYPLQNSGAKMKTALVFHGPQGTGKSLFFESYMSIFGEYGRIIDQSAIEDKFNDWASRKLFLIADEVVARQELYHVKNKLKGFITGPTIRINSKNIIAYEEKNHVNMVFLSNESTPLVLENDDRRYTVVHTPEKLSPEFYNQVRDEIKNGGIPALHHYLLNLELGDFDEHTKPPMTRARADLIEVSMDSVSSFIAEWSAAEVADAPFCPCLGTHLYQTYRKHCERTGERSPRSLKQFIGSIKMLPGWQAGQPCATLDNLHETKRITRRLVVPPVELLASSAINGTSYTKKDEQTEVHWLTECYFIFMNAGEFAE